MNGKNTLLLDRLRATKHNIQKSQDLNDSWGVKSKPENETETTSKRNDQYENVVKQMFKHLR